MTGDSFGRVPPCEKLVSVGNRRTSGVQSPEEVLSIQVQRRARQLAHVNRTVRLAEEKTCVNFKYSEGGRYLEHYAAGVRIVAGEGAEMIDAERTRTWVGAA